MSNAQKIQTLTALLSTLSDENLAKMQELVQTLVYDNLIPKGWKIAIINGVPQDVAPTAFNIRKLKPRSFLKRNDGPSISGKEMRQRAIEMKANLGLADGKRLLANGGKLIPAEFRGFYIPLPGTLLRDSDGYLRVPYLRWVGGRWCLYFGWLGLDWDAGGRFACGE